MDFIRGAALSPVVNLHGKNLRQRAEALISIAHPDFRAELTKDVVALRHFVL
jgi:acyl-CoA hydrolase